MSDTARYALVMFTAGLGIPVLAALNAALGQRIGSPATAATVLFVVAFLCAAVAMMLTDPKAITRLAGQPPVLFLAGAFIAFYVLTITWIAPKFGVGNAVFLVLLGQLVSSALIGHFGMAGARIEPITLTRLAGIGTMTLGIYIALKG